jgi:hypothetical protein
MRELTKSMVSYTWAMSVFGVQQTLNLLNPNGQGAGAQAMRNVADATAETFGPTLKAVYHAGDNIQGGLVDLMFGGMMSGGLDPNRWMQSAADTMRRMGDVGNLGAQSTAAGMAGAANAGAAAANAGAAAMGAQPGASSGWGPMPR